MSSKRLDKISDYARHGFNLKVDCRECGHSITLSARSLSELCQKRHWSRDMDLLGAKLKCSACGARNVRFGPAFSY